MSAPKPFRSLVLGEKVFAAARQNRRRLFARELADHCQNLLPFSFIGVAPEERTAVVESYIVNAAAHKITQRGSVFVWAETSLVFGAHFMSDPLCKTLQTSVSDHNLTQIRRARRLHSRLEEHASTALGKNGAVLLTALHKLEHRLEQGRVPATTEIVREIWPERVQSAAPEGIEAFETHIERVVDGLGKVDPLNNAVLGACCLFFGAWAWADPLRPWITKALKHPLNQGEDTALFKMASKFFEGAKLRLEAAQ